MPQHDRWEHDAREHDAREHDGGESLPLTPAQRGMWFAENLSPEYSVNVAHYLDLRYPPESLDHELLGECNIAAAKTLESPYVRLLDQPDGTPGQVVDLHLPITVDIIDFRAAGDPVAAALAWMRAEYQRPLDIRTDKLVVTALLRVADDRTFWYGRGHHIVIDGYAALTMVRMTVDRYNAVRRGAELTEKPIATLAEVVADEQKYQDSSRRADDRQYWRDEVAEPLERATLSQRAAGAVPSAANLTVSTVMAGGLQRAVEVLAREQHTSVAVVLSTAFAAYLNRATGLGDIVLALPVTGRAVAKIKRAGGMVSNVLPVRLQLAPSDTITQVLGRAQVRLTGALRHQRYRAEDIWRDAGRSTGTPAFGPVVNMVFFDTPIALDGVSAEYHILTSGIVEDILLNLYQASPNAPLVIDLHANPNGYHPDELAAHHRRFLDFLAALVAAPGHTPLAALPFGALDEGRLALAGPDPAAPATLAQLYAHTAAAHPDELAVVDADGTALSYRELDRQSTQLARWLDARGIGAESRIGLVLPRGADLVRAIWAAGKLGAAFVPVDPNHPPARVDGLLDRSGAQLVLSHGPHAGAVGPADQWIDLTSAATAAAVAAQSDDPIGPRGRSGNAAYLTYTSGSTGIPKGVVVTTAAAANLAESINAAIPTGPGTRILGFASPGFDASIGEILHAARAGATIVFRPESAPGGEELADYLNAAGIGLACLTPTVAATVDPADVPGLTTLLLVGESVPAALVQRWTRAGRTVHNGYGPTETTVGVTYTGALSPRAVVPIGTPIAGAGLHVLDAMLAPAPAGVVGELYLSGLSLARGYAHEPGLTAERFVASPFGRAGERMYRTGDLARWHLHDGQPEVSVLGRRDFQVKVRGQRIEPGEIEAALRARPGVDDALVLGVDADGRPSSRATALIAYAAMSTTDTGAPDRIRADLARTLPAHLVPDSIVAVAALPRTPAGKVDRAALPQPAVGREHADYVAPQSPVERRLVELVAELTDTDGVGIGDNLFRLGANSLSASRLAYRVRAELGVDLGMQDYFESPDLADLAGRIERERTVEHAPRPPLIAAPRRSTIRVSPAQTRLWFVNRLDPRSPAYNMPGAVRLGPDVDLAALRQAIADVVVRHETLRTRFIEADGEPTQVIDPVDTVRVDHTVIVAEVADLAEAVARTAATGFDLSAGAFRAVLLRGPADNVLVVVLHHIIGDGASLRPLIADVLAAYDARSHGFAPFFPPMPIHYADYARWHSEVLGDPADPASVAHRDVEYWTRQLAGAPEVIALRTDRPRPARRSGGGDYVDRVLTASAAAGLRALAAQSGVTLFCVLEAALAVVLSRLADTDDVVIGTAVAGRDEPQVADLIGMFVNTAALRTAVAPSMTVRELLGQVHRSRAEALAHAQTPFERIVDAVAPSRTLSHSPIFQVTLTLVDDAVGGIDDGELSVELLDVRAPAAKYDLSVTATEQTTGELGVEINYATDLFDEQTVEALADYLERTLGTMVADPGARLGQIDLLAPGEVRELVAPAPGSAPPQTLRRIVADWLATTCARDEPTLLTGDVTLSATAASSRINQLARELIARGVGPGSTVVVRLLRSVDSVVAMAATAIAGAAFVHIDPRLPALRQTALWADSGAHVGVTCATLAAPAADGDWIVLQDEAAELHLAGHPTMAVAEGELTRPILVDDVAYVINTSGSTGRPKAVEVSHRGLATLIAGQRDHLDCGPESVVLQVASPAFDLMVLELTTAMDAGARLVVAAPDAFAGVPLAMTIADGGVTHVLITPTVLGTLDPAMVPGLTTVFTGGEACPEELAHTWGARRRFLNGYGPSEFTIWATVDGPIEAGNRVTIGRPLTGVRALVLDRGLRPTPPGVVGDLYLGGEQIARGYRRRPGLTAGAFVADPFGTGGRLYRTGDRAARGDDGTLTYHGRSDFQLKIRGLRIEPGEVDAVLGTHPAVANALTVGADGPGGTVLATYVSPPAGRVIAPESLLAFAREHLPSHLVPQVIEVVEEFPRTPIGKIDRAALPPIEFRGGGEYVAPRTELEATIAAVVAAVLDLDRVSVDDGFFDIGGNSLSAAKVAARLASILDRPVSIEAVFEAPTAAGLAAWLVDTHTPGIASPPLIGRPRAAVVPVSPAQRGLWLINQANPDSCAYNIPLTLRLRGDLDPDALRAALLDVIARHESLRTKYPMMDGVPVQVIESTSTVARRIDLSVTDLSDSTDEETEQALAQMTDTGFNVAAAVPLRAGLWRIADDEHIVSLVVHHISVDGASMSPLARDLMTAYAARRAGSSPHWAPLPVQFADYTMWSADRLDVTDGDGVTERERQLCYWHERLDGAPELLGIPTDRPRPAAPTFAGGDVEFEIPAELVASLTRLARAHNTTLFMVAHAALAVLLREVSGQHDVVVGTPYIGRAADALDDVVGMFVNTVPLRTTVDSAIPFADLLDQVRGADLADLAHTDVAFEEIVTALGRGSTAGYNPIFQVMFTFQNLGFPVVELAGLRVEPEAVPTTTVQTDLGLILYPNDPLANRSDGGMRASWTYASELFDEKTVRRFASWYLAVLDAVALDPTVPVGDIALERVAGVAPIKSEVPTLLPLSQAVAAAALVAPDRVAADFDGQSVSFGELADAVTALAAVLPDLDRGAVLTTALFTPLPGLTTGGPEALDEVLTQLRRTTDEVSTVERSAEAAARVDDARFDHDQGTSDR
ncbi:non-ribosomal peptide synthetase [Gordonia defluvii]|uniref:Non-ribosomal peptide synthetase n=1 Tax=Gordonia defluvii TaxID=283718 RepID=A0ABN3YDG2_9ACTN|nr:non-ribosomal peptide synthetase [Gordonia sp. UBA5067]